MAWADIDGHPENWPRWRTLLPHLRTILDNHPDHDRWDDDVPQAVSWLCDLTGTYLDQHGQPDIAIPYLTRALALDESHLGPDHPDTMTSRNNLGLAYQAARRLDEAITLHQQNLTDMVRVLGPDHPHTELSRRNLTAARAARDG
ncbi:conserved hypothetical protein [Parafrankia sp. EAN1pec]|uniref:tetratricopeptide repeat protein n=1 Tax=Parafrankia sp. (strain EAN1pec) TaxID=298653 RepID=UPI0000541D9B|nr:conserved hypothetical protein [Frankia sp. EAN1pec]